MGGRFTEIPQETFEQIVVDAGVLLRHFDIADPDYDITPDIITATTGGVELSAEMEITDLGEDVDNCANDTKELARLTSWNCRIASTAIGSSPEIMQMVLGAADLSGDIDVIPRAVLELSDFKDLWWVGDRVDGGLLAVHIANALSISGLSLQTSKAQKGQFDFAIQAHVSIYDTDRVPMTFYVMAPGAWEITGLVLEDFQVEKGVPTQIPVKFQMGDGSVMEPSDYRHHFTYSATLPAGGTLTPDGVITLTGKSDTVTVTVTYQKGDTTISETGTIAVMAAHPVDLRILNAPIKVTGSAGVQVRCEIVLSDGDIISPTDTATGFSYRLEGFEAGVVISDSGEISGGGRTGTGQVHVAYSAAGHTVTASAAVEIERAELPLSVDFVGGYSGTVSFTLSSSLRQRVYVDWGDGSNAEEFILPASAQVTARHTYETGVSSQKIRVYVPETGQPFAINPPVSGITTGRDIVFGIVMSDNADIFKKLYYNNWTAIAIPMFKDNPVASALQNFTYIPSEAARNPSVPVNSFSGCANLKTFTFVGKKLSYIEGAAFYGCASMETLDLSRVENVPILKNTSAFTGTPTSMRILVPADLVTQFKTATNWSAYASRIVGV